MVQFLFKNRQQTFSETNGQFVIAPMEVEILLLQKSTCSLAYCHTIKDCNVQRVGSGKITVFVAPKKYTK